MTKPAEAKAKGGAKMDRARLRFDPDTVIRARDYDKGKHAGVVCIFCRCTVNGVRSYPRNVGDEQILVEAHFRLATNVDHEKRCRYNIEKTIIRLVSNSRAIKSISPDATPILEKIAQGKGAEFRLHILMDALQKATFGFRPPPKTRYQYREPEEPPTGTNYVRTDKVLKPYFRTAKGILALAARIQQHEALAEWVRLKYGDQIIRWEQFFFDLDQYAPLFEYLLHEKREPRTSPPSYPRPIALALRVFPEREPLNINGDWRVIGRSCVISTAEGSRLAIRPVLYFRDRDLAEKKQRESYLLVCGIPRLGDTKPPLKASLNEHADIPMKIVDPRQVCQYTPM